MNMHKSVVSTLFCLLLIGLLAPLASAQSIEMRLKDGTRWRGAVGDTVELRMVERGVEITHTGEIVAAADLYIQLETVIAGETRTKTIFKDDIRAIAQAEARKAEEARPARSQSRGSGRSSEPKSPEPSDGFRGVFLLPLVGGVGQEVRHNEIKAIIEEADKFGPGQIIVLEIDSPGGAVTEMTEIANTILEGKKRHRIIAWIRRAISAGAATAACCDEIYFATEGSLGAITMLQGGGQSVGREMQLRNARYVGQWFEEGGRPAIIAHSMILAESELSYDRDPETGVVTWYPNLSGQYILSRDGENLVFNASNAAHSKFAQGIADTTDDLAKLLNFPEWREVNDAGRRIHQNWIRTVEQAQEQIRRAQFRYENPVGRDQIEVLGYQLRQLEEILRGYERLGTPRENLAGIDRQMKEIRKRIADLRRQQRTGGGRR